MIIPIREIIMFTGAILGSYTDLKTREVPDLINYSMMILGLIIATTFSLIYHSFSFIISSAIGLVAGFLIGSVMFFLRQWGGGDVKMIAGIGSLMGISPQEFPQIPLFIMFLALSMIAGAFYGIGYLIYIAFKNRKEFIRKYKEHSQKPINKWFKRIYLITTTPILIYLYLANLRLEYSVLILMLLVITIASFYLFIFGQVVSKISSTKKIKINQLTEGDWIKDDLESKGIKISKTGITEEEIKLLKNKGIKEVTIIEGIPFIPSFLFGLILTYFFI